MLVTAHNLGTACLELRKAKNLSRHTTAMEIGCTPETIKRWETCADAEIRTQLTFVQHFVKMYRKHLSKEPKIIVS